MAIIIWADFEIIEAECRAFAKEAAAVAAQVHAVEAIISEAKAVIDHSKLNLWRAVLIEHRRYNNFDLMRVVFYERVVRAAEDLTAQRAAEDKEVSGLAEYSIIPKAETPEAESKHVNDGNGDHLFEEYVIVEDAQEDAGETADDWSVISVSA